LLQVKSYEGLNQEVLRRSEARQYRLWLLLRALDLEGKGWIDYKEAQKAFLALGLSRRSFRDVLRKGESLWWTRGPNRIFYASLEKVCFRLRVLPGRPVVIPLDSLRKLSTFKRILYASFFTRERTISRARLMELWGVSRTTLRRWERATGIRIQQNYARSSKPFSAGRSSGRRLIVGSEEENGGPYWEVVLDRKRYLAWQIPNSYIYLGTEFAYAPYGLARKVRKRLTPPEGGGGYLRLYFRRPRDAHRYLRRQGEGVYLFDRKVPWGRLWVHLSLA